MKKLIFLLLSIVCSLNLVTSQSAITGYVDVDQLDMGKKEVLIYIVHYTDEMMKIEEELVAKRAIQGDGYFEFENTLFDNQDRIYKVQLQSDNPEISAPSRLFIHSNKDSLHFQKSNLNFNQYASTNLADFEWQKLKKFDKIQQAQLDHKKYVAYSKDSLQILLVKLIGIKHLSDKDLLKKDIKENRAYYLELLEEFKSSDLEPESYAYLESQCALITRDIVQGKFNVSLFFNGLSILALLGLFLYNYQLRRKTNTPIQLAPVASLSKQEETIKNLILEGKTNKEIAGELFISISTVKTHITNLYNKLGVSSRKEILQNK